MLLTIQVIGVIIFIVMEELINRPLGRFFLWRENMISRLDKLRADLKKAVSKRDAANIKVKELEQKLKEAEASEIVDIVANYQMSPEQLKEFFEYQKGKKETSNVKNSNESEVLKNENI